MKSPAITSIVLLIAITGFTQPATDRKENQYLGQRLPGSTPEKFATGTISSPLYEHSAPAFSADGHTVLWTVMPPYPQHARMLEMRYVNGQWSAPGLAAFADTTADDFYPSFSPDGRTLYFSSRRNLPGAGKTEPGIRLWKVAFSETGWSKPEPVDTAVVKVELYSHSISSRGNIYASRRHNNGSIFDISVYACKGAGWEKPVALPYNLNTDWYEDGAFIAPDESYLIFESDRPGGIGGSIDLYITFRTKQDGWTPAINMGPTVNSPFAERFARVSPDGKYLFFGSDREQNPGDQGSDIFWLDAGIIDQLRNNVSTLAGPPLNATGQHITEARYREDHVSVAHLLEEWSEVRPGDITAVTDRIAALRKNKDYATANYIYENLPASIEQPLELKIERVMLLFSLDRPQEARSLLNTFPQTPYQRFRYVRLAGDLNITRNYPESEAFYELALQISPVAVDYYNLGCVYALQGKKDEAFAVLEKAAAGGFNMRQQYQSDTDLDALKTDPRFAKLLEVLK